MTGKEWIKLGNIAGVSVFGPDTVPEVEIEVDTINVHFCDFPEIENVKVIEQEGNPIGVVIYFKDGTKQKAICQKGDAFNLETGVALCLLKWFYALSADGSDGTKNANNAIREAIQIRENKLAEIEAEKEAEKIMREANRQYSEKRHKKALKRREARIEEMVEALSRFSKIAYGDKENN